MIIFSHLQYSDLMFKLFTEVFNGVVLCVVYIMYLLTCSYTAAIQLPLAFVIEQRIFVTHGGLFSRDGVTLDEIRQIDRFKQPPNEGIK